MALAARLPRGDGVDRRGTGLDFGQPLPSPRDCADELEPALRADRTIAPSVYGAGESNPLSLAGPNSAPEQLLVWSIGLRQLGACQIPREHEPK